MKKNKEQEWKKLLSKALYFMEDDMDRMSESGKMAHEIIMQVYKEMKE